MDVFRIRFPLVSAAEDFIWYGQLSYRIKVLDSLRVIWGLTSSTDVRGRQVKLRAAAAARDG